MEKLETKMVQVTYFVELISSWCYWAEPAWASIKSRFADEVNFQWRVALLDAAGLPKSREQCDWFYRRSGAITRSAFMLNSGWFEEGRAEYHAVNLVGEAGKDFGFHDDRLRLALAHGALREGRKVGTIEECIGIIVPSFPGLDTERLAAAAGSPEVSQRVKESTEAFHQFKMTQRPSFLVENQIGDRAILSGLISESSLAAVVQNMLDDARAYQSFKAHFGAPPPR